MIARPSTSLGTLSLSNGQAGFLHPHTNRFAGAQGELPAIAFGSGPETSEQATLTSASRASSLSTPAGNQPIASKFVSDTGFPTHRVRARFLPLKNIHFATAAPAHHPGFRTAKTYGSRASSTF